MTSRLLFVTRRPPWPLNNGGRIRSHRLLEGLSQTFDTTLLTMAHGPDSPDGATDFDALTAAIPGLDLITVPGLGGGKRRAQLESLISSSSWNFGRYASDELRRAIADLVAKRSIDLVHVDDLGAALALPPDIPALTVYGSHNIEHHILDGDQDAGASPLRRLFATAESRKVAAEERRIWSTVDLTLAVSDHDAEVITRSGGKAALCPNGTDPATASDRRSRVDGDEVRLLFVGSAGYAPYERGLAWFVTEVLPGLGRRFPVTLDVVGERPKRPVEANGVHYRGYVDSLDDWYDQADVVVVPVFEGSGTRLKLVEAANRRRPVVTTALGAQGLPLSAGTHFLQAEEPDEFADAIERAATDDPGIDAMVASAAEAVEAMLWPRIAAELGDRYQAMVAAAHSAETDNPGIDPADATSRHR